MGVARIFGLGAVAVFGVVAIQWLVPPREAGSMSPAAITTDSDEARDKIRAELREANAALAQQPCSPANKARYVAAVERYAAAWLNVAACAGTASCGAGDTAKLDRAQRLFGTPLDRRLQHEMRLIHLDVEMSKADFRKENLSMVATLAGDARLNPSPRALKSAFDNRNAAPACRPISLAM